MMSRENLVNLLLLGAWWYLSFLCNAFAGQILKSYSPVALTCLQCATGALGAIVFSFFDVQQLWNKLKSARRKTLLQLILVGVLHVFGNLGTNFSLSFINVSFAHTVKAAEPVLCAILGVKFLGEQLTPALAASTGLVVLGVLLSSLEEQSFNFTGLYYALLSNVSFAGRNVVVKLLQKEKVFSEQELFFIMSCVSALGTLPALDSTSIQFLSFDNIFCNSSGQPDTRALLSKFIALACTFHFLYNSFSFSLLGRVSLLTHAIGNSLKRLFIVLSTAIYFNTLQQMTYVNLFGILFATSGAGMYGISKARAHLQRELVLAAAPVGGVVVSPALMAPLTPTSGPSLAREPHGAAASGRRNTGLFVLFIIFAILAGTSQLQYRLPKNDMQTAVASRDGHLSAYPNAEHSPSSASSSYDADQALANQPSNAEAQKGKPLQPLAHRQLLNMYRNEGSSFGGGVHTSDSKRRILVFSGIGNHNLGDQEQAWTWLQHIRLNPELARWTLFFARQVRESDIREGAKRPSMFIANREGLVHSNLCSYTQIPFSLRRAGWNTTYYIHPVCIIQRNSEEPVIKFSNFDAFIYGGGGLFATGGYHDFYHPIIASTMAVHQKPAFLMGVGCFMPNLAMYLNLLASASLIGVRDQESQAAINEFASTLSTDQSSRFMPRVKHVPDTMLALPAIIFTNLRKSVARRLQANGTPAPGHERICWIFKYYTEHLDSIAEVKKSLVEKQDKLVVMSADEFKVVEKNNLSYNHNYHTLQNTAKYMLTNCDGVASMVLHGSVLAVRLNLPLYGIRAGKIEGTLKVVGGDELVAACYNNRMPTNRTSILHCFREYKARSPLINSRIDQAMATFRETLITIDETMDNWAATRNPSFPEDMGSHIL